MWLEIGLVFVALFLFIYRYITKNFGKWEKMGIPCKSGRFPYGSTPEFLFFDRHFNERMEDDYNEFSNEPYYGTYLLGKPVLNIRDPELIRHILVKDFNHFVDRNDSNLRSLFEGGDTDTLWKMQLTSLSGNEWKDVRSTFSPIFTSGKMKGMLKFIVEVGQRLGQEVDSLAATGEDFELKTVFGKFSLDSIASCAFGVNPKSFDNESDYFVRSAARIFINTFTDNVKTFTRLIPGLGWIHKKLGINVFKPQETRFFMKVIRETLQQRRETGDRRNDIIDLMLDCMKPEDKKSDENDNIHDQDQYEADMNFDHKTRRHQVFDEDLVAATSMVMLVAGYDTTGLTLAWLNFYLSINPDIQKKLQEEIDDAYEANGGKLPDYNTIQNLPYLDNCVHETLRMASPVGNLFRACDKEYTLPNTNIVIKENDLLVVPVIGLHNDPAYYPNPKQFNPENFSKEARASRSPYTFAPFGQGPRACIGMRFALLEIKVAMLEVLRKYTFTPSNKNQLPFKLQPSNNLSYPKGGIWAKVQRRD